MIDIPGRSTCFRAAALALALLLAALAAPAQAQAVPKVEPFTLVDGDRVVLLGSTFVERDQAHGYLEAALTARYQPRNIQFRNLGWSGDNVFGEARARFGKVSDGYDHLKQHVLALNPTVILLAYGGNESFDGPAGLPTFLAGLETLLATLDETKARIVFVTPPPHEDLGRPLPDPAEHNKNLKRYSDAIVALAARRGAPVINLYEALSKLPKGERSTHLTDNGIHLTAYGYWRVAPVIEAALGLPERNWQIEIDASRKNIAARGTYLREARFDGNAIRFQARDMQLPVPPAPEGSSGETVSVAPRVLRCFDLPPGNYSLKVDGAELAQANARQWAEGVQLAAGPEAAQAEQLRKLILSKNELYFHRWRPQNETYLFGFRKHEQGNNAVEIPQFDPLVAERETEIRTLSQPAEHEYQLVPAEAK